MNITDIVNRDLVTLTNCEHEPIHLPGSIQPHGFLLGINDVSWKIDFCSSNIVNYLGITHTQVLGKTFTDVFGTQEQEVLKAYIENYGMQAVITLEMVLRGKLLQFTIHKSDAVYILEAEVHPINYEKVTDAYNQTVQFISYMSDTSTLKDLSALVAKGTRDITGYDRVMIYKFDKDYNGEVFAESCNDKIEPFLGLNYPHTDIPSQARDLYLKNLLRLITDVDYTPVPIYTSGEAESNQLDLSLSVLRSTSPVHVEYLANMGVKATLTISLIYKGKLWGLIACHHYSPKNITPQVRLAVQLQGQFITSQIDIRQANEEYDIAEKSTNALHELNALSLPPVFDSLKIIINRPELLTLCNAMGVSILLDGKIYKSGLTPSNDRIHYYSQWCSVYSADTTFYTNKIVDFDNSIAHTSKIISGIVYHSLGNGNSIIWYRPETLAEVNWAGDPKKAIVHDDKGMHPRKSFEQWKEIVKNTSTYWLQPEIVATTGYAHTVQKLISMMMLTLEEEKYRNLSEVLKEANSELENINWISTHDLQEPLRKIQMIASHALVNTTDVPSAAMVTSLNKMTNSAGRMQTLLLDILKYTRVKNARESFEQTSLNAVMKQTLEDMSDVITDANVTVTYTDLPNITAIPFLIKQLFANIISNSIKYSFPDRPVVIKVTASVVPESTPHLESYYGHWITFSDNGIGFEQKYAESIFNIFSRLHAQSEYVGSGVGLALCKKIIQTHNGNISATGTVGKGASITLYFPAEVMEDVMAV
jgi:chemotaxis family two-component system sensor kinase Cph1